MAQALHFALTHHRKDALIDNTANALEVFFFGGTRDLVLQLVRNIEVISDGAFATTGDKSTVIHSRGQRFFNPVLQQRFVNNG